MLHSASQRNDKMTTNWPNSLDDPEKHFLGNLLDDDTSFHTPNLSDGAENSSSGIPSVAVIPGVGSISSVKNFWPEPPPPYSPSVQPTPQSWSGSLGMSQASASSQPSLQFKELLTLKDSSEWANQLMFQNNSNSVLTPLATNSTPLVQPQIHHHHHNLHHHTHMHNVVETHHHYRGGDPRGPEQRLTTTPPPGFGPPSVDSNKDSCKSTIDTKTTSTANSSQKPYMEAVGAGRAQRRVSASNKEVHSAPVIHADKMPFSYRDVAARLEPQETAGTEFHHHQHFHDHHQQPAQQTKRSYGAGGMMNGDSDTRSEMQRTASAQSISFEPAHHSSSKEKKSSRGSHEFQKITKKNRTKQEKTSCDLPVYSVSTPKVEVPTRYHVLETLTSPRSKSSYPEAIVSKREVSRAAPMIAVIRSRSNSLVRDVDEDSHSSRKSHHVEHKRRTVPAATTSVAPMSSSVSYSNGSQKKRSQRRRSETGWMDIIVATVLLVAGWFEIGFKFVLTLVVDVCTMTYDHISFLLISMLHSLLMMIRRMGQSLLTNVLSIVGWISELDLRRRFLFTWERDEGRLWWGMEDNIQIPVSGDEALERLILLPSVDAYGVLGLRSDCSDEDVRRHHKRLASLLHPDKNPLEGAEEAYELTLKAFETIGTPEARRVYVPASVDEHLCQMEMKATWAAVRERVWEARQSLLCDCGRRHARVAVTTRPQEARFCRRCRNRHPAKSNDIWVESRLFGLVWVYYTCNEGVVYDISEWATCEVNYQRHLKHVRPNAHSVLCRLVTPGSAPPPAAADPRLREVQDNIEDPAGRGLHTQMTLRGLEPREHEDRSRRAANRRQKRR